MIPSRRTIRIGRWQMSLFDLLLLVTLCAILARLSLLTGIAAMCCLCAMTLALALRQGHIAIAAFALAILTAGWSSDDLIEQVSWNAQASVIAAAAALCAVYRLRAYQIIHTIASTSHSANIPS